MKQPVSPLPHRTDAADALRGNLCILIATIFFGVNIPVVKLLVPQWASANDITVFRIVGACIVFWTASLLRPQQKLARGDYSKVFLGGGLGLFAFIMLFNMSLRYGDPIDISIIMTLPPLMVILIGILFRHYRSSLLEWAGALLALAGAVMVIVCGHARESGTDNLVGNLLAVASALCYSLYLIALEKPSHTYKPVSLMRWVFLAASVPALVLIPAMHRAPIFINPEPTPWLLVAFIVLCPTFLAYLLINPAIRLIGSEIVSLYQYLVPVVATIATVAMGLSHLHVEQVVAMLVIIAGMGLTVMAKGRKRS